MKLRGLLIAAAAALVTSACSTQSGDTETASKEVYAMDTVMILNAYGKKAEKALDEAEEEIIRLDKLFDRGNAESDVYAINAARTAEVSDDTAEVVGRAKEMNVSTDGAFDMRIASVMDLWGFYTDEYHVPTETELEDAMADMKSGDVDVDGNTVSLTGDVTIDLGGIAKGFTSDRIAEIFAKNKVSGIVSLGGNVQAVGEKANGNPWRVAIQDPDDESKYIGSVTVTDKAVITSGAYQRYFESGGKRYHHIIDPDTGRPAESGLKSVTIVTDDGTMGDGLSTSLYVMGLDEGEKYQREHGGFDVVFVTDDDEIFITQGLEGTFESDRAYEVLGN